MRGDDRFRVESAHGDDLVDLGDHDPSRSGHVGVEVACRLVVYEVAERVSRTRANERDVGLERVLEEVGDAVDVVDLAAPGQLRADAGADVERPDARPAGPDG